MGNKSSARISLPQDDDHMGEIARQGAASNEDLIWHKVNRIRHWELTTLGENPPESGFQFTVMTYNILSQSAVESHMHLYKNCNPQYLSEEYRIARILPEILHSLSDIVCLQEVEQHLFDQRIRVPVDSNGFGSLFKKGTGEKTDGCAILWNREKFDLIGHKAVEFRNSNCKVLDFDKVGLIAVLRPRHLQASQTQLHVATTHVLFDPMKSYVKLYQLRFLLAELERSALKNVGEDGREYHPTLLCGDFNFEPNSTLYQFVESGRLNIDDQLAGNISGQHAENGKGNAIHGRRLSMDGLDIDWSGRFRDESENSRLLATGSSNCMVSGGETSSSSQAISCNITNDTMNSKRKGSSSNTDLTSQPVFHDFNFVPAYKYQRCGTDLPISSMTALACHTVDHIFYTVKRKDSPTSYEEGSLKLLGVYTLPLAGDLRGLGGLPNALLCSDHLSIMAKFIIL